eukprot:scaffold33462_cov112-Isochrysis_galbana.AAC.2
MEGMRRRFLLHVPARRPNRRGGPSSVVRQRLRFGCPDEYGRQACPTAVDSGEARRVQPRGWLGVLRVGLQNGQQQPEGGRAEHHVAVGVDGDASTGASQLQAGGDQDEARGCRQRGVTGAGRAGIGGRRKPLSQKCRDATPGRVAHEHESWRANGAGGVGAIAHCPRQPGVRLEAQVDLLGDGGLGAERVGVGEDRDGRRGAGGRAQRVAQHRGKYVESDGAARDVAWTGRGREGNACWRDDGAARDVAWAEGGGKGARAGKMMARACGSSVHISGTGRVLARPSGRLGRSGRFADRRCWLSARRSGCGCAHSWRSAHRRRGCT